jgi:hypothetical protein
MLCLRAAPNTLGLCQSSLLPWLVIQIVYIRVSFVVGFEPLIVTNDNNENAFLSCSFRVSSDLQVRRVKGQWSLSLDVMRLDFTV